MTPRDRPHLAALRDGLALCERRGCKGKRRNDDLYAFMSGAASACWFVPNSGQTIDLYGAVALIGIGGYREVLAQLHILEAAERGGRTNARAKSAEEV